MLVVLPDHKMKTKARSFQCNPANLAHRARLLRQRAVTQLKDEPENGPLRNLYNAVKAALVHDQKGMVTQLIPAVGWMALVVVGGEQEAVPLVGWGLTPDGSVVGLVASVHQVVDVTQLPGFISYRDPNNPPLGKAKMLGWHIE